MWKLDTDLQNTFDCDCCVNGGMAEYCHNGYTVCPNCAQKIADLINAENAKGATRRIVEGAVGIVDDVLGMFI